MNNSVPPPPDRDASAKPLRQLMSRYSLGHPRYDTSSANAQAAPGTPAPASAASSASALAVAPQAHLSAQQTQNQNQNQNQNPQTQRLEYPAFHPPMALPPPAMYDFPDEVVLTDTIQSFRRTAVGHRIVNQYIIGRRLGKGQHGEVFHALDLSKKDAHVAVKAVKRKEKADKHEQLRKANNSAIPRTTGAGPLADKVDGAEKKILREIAIMKKCRHGQIVRLLEVINDRLTSKILMVMEYMGGGEIRWRDDKKRPTLTVDQARRICRDVVLGLEYLHHQGIIHRDIKPANLLWTDERKNVKITDFGVSHFNYALRLEGIRAGNAYRATKEHEAALAKQEAERVAREAAAAQRTRGWRARGGRGRGDGGGDGGAKDKGRGRAGGADPAKEEEALTKALLGVTDPVLLDEGGLSRQAGTPSFLAPEIVWEFRSEHWDGLRQRVGGGSRSASASGLNPESGARAGSAAGTGTGADAGAKGGECRTRSKSASKGKGKARERGNGAGFTPGGFFFGGTRSASGSQVGEGEDAGDGPLSDDGFSAAGGDGDGAGAAGDLLMATHPPNFSARMADVPPLEARASSDPDFETRGGLGGAGAKGKGKGKGKARAALRDEGAEDADAEEEGEGSEEGGEWVGVDVVAERMAQATLSTVPDPDPDAGPAPAPPHPLTLTRDAADAPLLSDDPSRPPVTKAIDVWALGVTLFCLLFGDVPWLPGSEYVLYRMVHENDFWVYDLMGADEVPSGGRHHEPGDTSEGAVVIGLLERLMEKDWAKRMTLDELKHFPWITRDIPNPNTWFEKTSPFLHDPVTVNEADENAAMTDVHFRYIPKLPFGDRIRALVSRGGRRRPLEAVRDVDEEDADPGAQTDGVARLGRRVSRRSSRRGVAPTPRASSRGSRVAHAALDAVDRGVKKISRHGSTAGNAERRRAPDGAESARGRSKSSELPRTRSQSRADGDDGSPTHALGSQYSRSRARSNSNVTSTSAGYTSDEIFNDEDERALSGRSRERREERLRRIERERQEALEKDRQRSRRSISNILTWRPKSSRTSLSEANKKGKLLAESLALEDAAAYPQTHPLGRRSADEFGQQHHYQSSGAGPSMGGRSGSGPAYSGTQFAGSSMLNSAMRASSWGEVPEQMLVADDFDFTSDGGSAEDDVMMMVGAGGVLSNPNSGPSSPNSTSGVSVSNSPTDNFRLPHGWDIQSASAPLPLPLLQPHGERLLGVPDIPVIPDPSQQEGYHTARQTNRHLHQMSSPLAQTPLNVDEEEIRPEFFDEENVRSFQQEESESSEEGHIVGGGQTGILDDDIEDESSSESEEERPRRLEIRRRRPSESVTRSRSRQPVEIV